MEDNKLEIIITAKDEASAVVKKVGDEVQKTTNKVNDSGKSVIENFKEQQKAGVSLIRMVTRVGFIWAATAGLIIKGLVDLGKEIETLDRLSFKLGISASDLSIRFYGFDITTQSARISVAALQNTFSNFHEALLKIKLGVADVISTNDILMKQYGVLGAMTMGLTGFASTPKMSSEDAIASIMAENVAKRAASKEGQTLLIAEDDLFNQLSLSKVENTRRQFEQQTQLLQYYGIDTARIREEFAVRTAQDEEMELDKLIAQRYEAENKTTEALGYQLDAQLMAYKRIWGEDGKVVQQFIKTQTVLAQKKHWDLMITNIDATGQALDKLGTALAAAAEMGRGFATAAKVVALAMAIMNTAQGVTKALADYPWPFSMIVAGIIAAAGAIQIATITSTKFAEGGIVTRPTNALIGEAGPEAVIPLKDYGGRFGNQTTIHIEVNNPVVRSDEDIDKLTEEISMRLAREAERL